MKTCIKYKKNLIKKNELDILHKFCKLLFKKMPLKKDLQIHLLEKKQEDMTTGSFNAKMFRIRVLFKNRMLADVLRTLSHEWAHAYDHEKLKIKDREDIGGKSEDFANSKSGELTKLFIKKNKKKEKEIFN
jgi:Tfp pilus assembly pilus retraction ATPase PilT